MQMLKQVQHDIRRIDKWLKNGLPKKSSMTSSDEIDALLGD